MEMSLLLLFVVVAVAVIVVVVAVYLQTEEAETIVRGWRGVRRRKLREVVKKGCTSTFVVKCSAPTKQTTITNSKPFNQCKLVTLHL